MPDADNNDFYRAKDFVSRYANNMQVETSAWDLKLIFGQLDQSTGSLQVEQHTTITLPWAHAKVATYFLAINLAYQQHVNGNILLPPAVVPPRPDPSALGQRNVPEDLIQYLLWLHDQFFGEGYHPTATASVETPPSTE
ncbi:MAG: hypothetical protein ABI693_05660 [Bryobacteraceae bacterium]